MANKNYYTVFEFNSYVKNIFDYEQLLHNVPIMGEVSGCSVVSSHCYFTLKDKQAQINVVCFDCKKTYIPQNGQQVLVVGRPDFYVKGGRLSINARTIQPFGIGQLLEQLERLKEKLAQEGLFDKDKKKPILPFPNKIAIITSAKGAALQDILTTIYQKNTQQQITVIDVRVQGENASSDIIKALKGADRLAFDVIVIARGGGSFEDLFAFNDESLVRTIASANTPIISAVGHESDYTLCDFVADERAITPTAAAQIIGYDINAVKQHIDKQNKKMTEIINNKLKVSGDKIFHFVNEFNHKWKNLLINQYYIIRNFCDRIKANVAIKIQNEDYRINTSLKTLDALSPTRLLQKGYFRVLKDTKQITKVSQLDIEDRIDIYAFDGKVRAKIIEKEEFSL